MTRVPPDAWRPRGIADLEPQAWRALRQTGSTSVVAGPGAGKTEFLAQRAVYLLETAVCPSPFRVLAISFKSDAAENLASRVRQRCPPELANRFVSMTFDAFTKSLVDRFLSAIPHEWRPTKHYTVDFPTRRQIEEFLDSTRRAAPRHWQDEIAGVPTLSLQTRVIGTYALPKFRVEPRCATDFVVDSWWMAQLHSWPRSRLSFVEINRLAELLLRTRPHILAALRATYPFVFVDEFQDTTHAQYDFLFSAFAGGQAAVTAVGDYKQRIMGWAGARADVFERFEIDFWAQRVPLFFNFRSSPDLVRIQHVVARALDIGTVKTQALAARQVDGAVAQVWNSQSREAEACYLAVWLADDMARRGKRPRDYALLVRQLAENVEPDFVDPLADVGLRLRNESRKLGRTTLQDLLADDVAQLGLALLRLGTYRQDAQAWGLVSAGVQSLRAVSPDDEARAHRVEAELTEFLSSLRHSMANAAPNRAAAACLSTRVFDFLDRTAVVRSYLQYSHGDLLAIVEEAFSLHLANCADAAADWASCLDSFAGVDQIPMMTVHKSKGLEYDTIVFIGLDDQAWWSHSAGNPDGIATFFVALSRAKQRAIFSFCQARGSRRKVADLFQLLTDADVQEIAI